MPLILACDTTQAACSAALHGDAPLAGALAEMTAGHAEALMPMIETLLAETGCPPSDVERLAVTRGPGTFTGTRVGLAAMRGLALALDVPLKTYGTLAVMAAAVDTGLPQLVAVDARRGAFYVQGFAADKTPVGEAQSLSADQAVEQAAALQPAGRVAVSGSGAAALAALAPEQFSVVDALPYPQAAVLAALAAADADWDNLPPAEPLYLRPPDAALPNPDKLPARK